MDRFKELQHQAFAECKIFEADMINTDEAFAKFGELIVRECINHINIERGNPYRNMEDTSNYGISACDESIDRIKNYFRPDSVLTVEEIAVLESNGWEIMNICSSEYVYAIIPDDYDGCHANGLRAVKRVVAGYLEK